MLTHIHSLQRTQPQTLKRKPVVGFHAGRESQLEKVRNILRGPVVQPQLKIGAPNDKYEQEADRVAEQVMRMPAPQVTASGGVIQRTCTSCLEENKLEEGVVQTKPIMSLKPSNYQPSEFAQVPSIVHDVLRSSGQPLDEQTRAFMEPRFGYDFSQVRVHTDDKAAESARAVSARAYTVGHHVVMRQEEYAPATEAGRWLLAHELVHVVQQNVSQLSSGVVQRQGLGDTHTEDFDAAAEREYANSGAPKAKKGVKPSWCPAGFCDPYSSEKLAIYYRSKQALWLMAGISVAVNSRVVPLWKEYLWGGSPPKNLSAEFGQDFTNSPTTHKATQFLYNELKKSLAAKPPLTPNFSNTFVDITTQIPSAIAELDDPSSKNLMNFNIVRDIPGNLAGNIGKDQAANPVGARPSPFNDERRASGMVQLTRTSGPNLTVIPLITYTVKDTIDLCPGDCGTLLEPIATVPLSQFEATGISGDVPFIVEFPAPFLGPFTI